MADREGFEPSVPFGGTHDFQSCAFDHSAIYPNHEHAYIVNKFVLQQFFIEIFARFIYKGFRLSA